MSLAVRSWGFALGVALVVASATAWAGESAESLFPFAGVTEVQVSPEGRWIAASAFRDDVAVVMVQRVGLPTMATIVKSSWIGQVAWDSSDTLIVEALTQSDRPALFVAKLRVVDGEIKADHRVVFAPGDLVHPLPFAPETVLWQFGYEGWTSLHRITIQELIDFNELVRFSPKSVEIADKVAIVNGPADRWVVDRDGNPRAAWRRDEKGHSVMMPARGNGPLQTVYRYAEDAPEREVVPVGLTANGSHVIVRAYKGKDTRGLYKFDQKAGASGEAIFVDPDLDVDDALIDQLTGDLIAASYEENGEPRYHYFPEYRDRFISKLPEEWRKDSIAILNGTVDRQVFAFLDSSATNPGIFYLRSPNDKIARLGTYGENVDREKLSPVESFRVKSRDGVEIEAFLTLPRTSPTPAPLVVMPHGGPHGVRDSRRFDPFVQYLASWGFAVLQVNYRGSTGYGLEFEKLGKKERAKGIEDDIDAAVDHAMTLPTIERSRICIVGGSYGGFSAFASVVRHRDRYRCAISINGASDIPLSAESSDFADDKQSMAFWKEYVGDLETDRKGLLEISPAYHVAEIDAPVLIIYGTDDRRVDPDHSHRMILMLELYGKKHETLEIEGAEHGFERDEWIIVARSVRRFLSSHLTPETPFERDPGTR